MKERAPKNAADEKGEREGAMINDIREICSSYKMIAYIMIFVHNDRLRTVHDDIQTVKIDIQ